MKRTMITLLLALMSVGTSGAETYKWTDNHGVVSFTDDPALIPSRYRSKAQKVKDVNVLSPREKLELKRQKEKRSVNQPATRRNTTKPVNVQPVPVPQGMQQTIRGHLGGDQIDPAPPSMKQPIPAALGDQPKPASPGMKQPIPVPTGVQPKPEPPGMIQPTPVPLGKQPTPTPLGMEQPTPKQ
jgi:hypothetical protein